MFTGGDSGKKTPTDWRRCAEHVAATNADLQKDLNGSQERYTDLLNKYNELSNNFTRVVSENAENLRILDDTRVLLKCDANMRILPSLEWLLNEHHHIKRKCEQIESMSITVDTFLNWFRSEYQLSGLPDIIASYTRLADESVRRNTTITSSSKPDPFRNVTRRKRQVKFDDHLDPARYSLNFVSSDSSPDSILSGNIRPLNKSFMAAPVQSQLINTHVKPLHENTSIGQTPVFPAHTIDTAVSTRTTVNTIDNTVTSKPPFCDPFSFFDTLITSNPPSSIPPCNNSTFQPSNTFNLESLNLNTANTNNSGPTATNYSSLATFSTIKPVSTTVVPYFPSTISQPIFSKSNNDFLRSLNTTAACSSSHPSTASTISPPTTAQLIALVPSTVTSIPSRTTTTVPDAQDTSPATALMSSTVASVPVPTATDPPLRYKRAPIPVFSGTPKENVSDWIFIIELHFKADKVPDTEKVLMAAAYLRDLPLLLYRRLSHTDNLNWNSLKTELMATFQPFDMQMNIRDEMHALKQNGNKFEEYLRQFNTLLNRTDDISERDKISYFRRGLQRQTAHEVQFRQPATLDEAIRIAAAYEQRFKTTTTDTDSSKSKTVVCFHCKRSGHLANQCRRYMSATIGNSQRPPRQDNFRSVPPNASYNHNNNNNYNQPQGQTRNNARSNGNPPGRPPTAQNNQPQQQAYTGYINHGYQSTSGSQRSTYMSATQATTPDQLLTVSGKIHDVPSTFVLDTAANVSVINSHFVPKLNCVITPTDVTMHIADATPSTVSSITEPLRIDIHGSTSQIPLLIRPLPTNVQVLLGLDWFRLTNSYVDPTDRTLSFKRRDINLTDNTPKETEDDDDSPDDHACFISEAVEEEEILDDQTWEYNTSIIDLDTSKFPTSHADTVLAFINKNSSMFAQSYDTLGCCQLRQHVINTTTEQPIYLHAYRKSLAERDIIKNEVAKMLQANIIRPSESPWSFPVVLPGKPDGISRRFCVDYRRLNEITIQDNFPLPRIDDILDRLSGSQYFTALDLKSGYWQMEMHPQSIAKTAFSTPDGHYEFLRLPFGLKNAPADFSRLMFQALGHLPFIQIYLDDITVHSKTFEEHMEHLDTLLTRLKALNLKINFSKCSWLQTKIKLLGHLVSKDSVEMDPDKIVAIKEMPPPRTIKQLQRFLGLCGYYRRFIHRFSHVASPMYALLKKESIWCWNHKCQLSFDSLKDKLIDYPVNQIFVYLSSYTPMLQMLP